MRILQYAVLLLMVVSYASTQDNVSDIVKHSSDAVVLIVISDSA